LPASAIALESPCCAPVTLTPSVDASLCLGYLSVSVPRQHRGPHREGLHFAGNAKVMSTLGDQSAGQARRWSVSVMSALPRCAAAQSEARWAGRPRPEVRTPPRRASTAVTSVGPPRAWTVSTCAPHRHRVNHLHTRRRRLLPRCHHCGHEPLVPESPIWSRPDRPRRSHSRR
jgi:hypothetical protein